MHEGWGVQGGRWGGGCVAPHLRCVVRPPLPRYCCRYVRDMNRDEGPEEALSDFIRFPQWMWRNTVVRDFLGW